MYHTYKKRPSPNLSPAGRGFGLYPSPVREKLDEGETCLISNQSEKITSPNILPGLDMYHTYKKRPSPNLSPAGRGFNSFSTYVTCRAR